MAACLRVSTTTLAAATGTLPAALGAAPDPIPPSPATSDKSSYHLFRRTPPDLRRGLETDRPDVTESPITVDAGWFQVEADLFSYSHTSSHGQTTDEIAAPVLNLKAGLLHNLDLQLVLSPFQHLRHKDSTTSPSTETEHSGFGDLQIRSKLNLWGNDGGRTAFAAMPFVQVPTGGEGISSEAVEGGLILPFAFELPAGFGAGVMWEVDVLQNEADSGYHADFVQTFALGRDLTDRLSAYVEFVAVVSTAGDEPWIGLIDGGLNLMITEDIKLDCGVNVGVTRSAPDWNPFAGITWRF